MGVNDTLSLLKQHHSGGTEFVMYQKIADFGCGPGILLQMLRKPYPHSHLIDVKLLVVGRS